MASPVSGRKVAAPTLVLPVIGPADRSNAKVAVGSSRRTRYICQVSPTRWSSEIQESGRVPAFPLSTKGLADLGGLLAAPFGRGCPGTGGLVPRISTTGLPRLGNAGFAIDLDSARPDSNAVLGMDVQRGLLRLDDCRLYLPNVLVALPGRTDANGRLAMRFAVPTSSALIGAEAFVQFMVRDPNGAWSAGASFSSGMHLLVNK
jgi:hypothetical protein